MLQESKKNVLKMSVAVVVAFAFCWFLMHLNMFLIDLSDVLETCGIPIWLLTAGFLLGHSNGAPSIAAYTRYLVKNIVGALNRVLSLCFGNMPEMTTSREPQISHWKVRWQTDLIELCPAPQGAEFSSFKCNVKL